MSFYCGKETHRCVMWLTLSGSPRVARLVPHESPLIRSLNVP